MQSNQFVYVVFGGAPVVRQNAVCGLATSIVKAEPDLYMCGALCSEAVYSSNLDEMVTLCCNLALGYGSFKYSVNTLPY